MAISGTEYHTGDILVLQFVNDLPEFGEIKDIVINKDRGAAFIVRVLQTECYNYHYHSYEVTDLESFRIVIQDELVDFHPLCLHELSVSSGIVVKLVQLKYNVI